MKKGKIWLVILLALLFVFQVGCSSSEEQGGSGEGDAGGKNTITFWSQHSGAEGEFFEDLVKEYNNTQNNVKVEYKSFNQNDYNTKALPVAFANNEGPDIFTTSPGDFMKFAQSGIMADLKSYFPEGAMEDFNEAAIDDVTYEDKILALPFESEPLGLYYNKDMFEEADIDVPSTWEELTQAASQLTTDSVAGLIIPSNKEVYTNFVWYPFLWQTGGKVLNKDETESTFNSTETAKALDYYGSFFQEGYTPSKTKIEASDIEHLGSGQAAMQIAGPWSIKEIEENYKDTNIGVTSIPAPEDGKEVTVAGGWKLAANSNSEHLDEAAKFIMWAFAEDPSRPLEWVTEAKFAYPVRDSVIEEGQEIYDKGLRKVFTDEIYDTARPEPRFGPETVDAIGEALQEVMFDGVSGEDAAEKADQQIQESLSE